MSSSRGQVTRSTARPKRAAVAQATQGARYNALKEPILRAIYERMFRAADLRS